MKVHLKEPDESKPVGKLHFNLNRFLFSKKLINIRVLNTENQLICELCGMSYTQAAGLSDHKKTAHSNERPFKCNVCRLG